METFFHSDSRIQQWLEQIIEKIIIVCLLKGTESEAVLEFKKGRQLVGKISLLLTDISSLPPSAVFDAILQLLKQRLPDQRIIDNFPNFYQVMEAMIGEGITSVAENDNPQIEQNSKSLEFENNMKQPLKVSPIPVIILSPKKSESPTAIETTIETNKPDIETHTISEPLHKMYQEKALMIQTPSDKDLCIQGFLDIPVLAAKVDSTFTENLQVTSTWADSSLTEINELVSSSTRENEDSIPDPFPGSPKQTSFLNSIQNTFPGNHISLTTTNERLDIPTEPTEPTEQFILSDTEILQNSSENLPFSNRVRRSSQVPAEATRLALVLQQIFPNTQARWNFCLGEHNFLVQIKDLLIYLETLTEGNRVVKEMKKQGWQILVCKAEDLCFPRRIEREIHRIFINSK
ncbi:MAG: hypothetical protein ACYDEJ_09640 [Desulfitobacteriaceae bacterium]